MLLLIKCKGNYYTELDATCSFVSYIFFTSQMKGALFPEGLYPHIKAWTGDKHMKLI